jgi:predicted ATPase
VDKPKKHKSKLDYGDESIEAISIRGFKSLYERATIELAPLTVIAGANSSGKSSLMQAVLLLKQTLDAETDPGPLLLSGAHVNLTSSEKLFSKLQKRVATKFQIGLATGYKNQESRAALQSSFSRVQGKLRLDTTAHRYGDSNVQVSRDLTDAEALKQLRPSTRQHLVETKKLYGHVELFPKRNRCCWELWYHVGEPNPAGLDSRLIFSNRISHHLRHIIHVPGLRGNPARAYPVNAVGLAFPAPFDLYTASVISKWQSEKDADRIRGLASDLQTLGLTWSVKAVEINETQVEIMVGRLTKAQRGGARDLINIADVGFGLSQVLPVVAALRVAESGQLVYIEQPELHLHPRAQAAMADVLVEAANRGVRIVIETHSSLLLLAIQTLVAEGDLEPGLVKLHWFARDEATGLTTITSNTLDKKASFGDWPEDFGTVTLEAQGRFLDAIEKD